MTSKDDRPPTLTEASSPTTPINRVSYAGSTTSSSTAADEGRPSRSFEKRRRSEDDNDSLLAIPTSPPPIDIVEEASKAPDRKQIATWASLPRKGQLAL